MRFYQDVMLVSQLQGWISKLTDSSNATVKAAIEAVKQTLTRLEEDNKKHKEAGTTTAASGR